MNWIGAHDFSPGYGPVCIHKNIPRYLLPVTASIAVRRKGLSLAFSTRLDPLLFFSAVAINPQLFFIVRVQVGLGLQRLRVPAGAHWIASCT